MKEEHGGEDEEEEANDENEEEDGEERAAKKETVILVGRLYREDTILKNQPVPEPKEGEEIWCRKEEEKLKEEKPQDENQEDLKRYENADADHGSGLDAWARRTLWKVAVTLVQLLRWEQESKDHINNYKLQYTNWSISLKEIAFFFLLPFHRVSSKIRAPFCG